LAHHACADSTEQHISREKAHLFVAGVRKRDLRRELLFGGKRTLSEALIQALELETMDIVAQTPSWLQ
jgi:hypothetical protein